MRKFNIAFLLSVVFLVYSFGEEVNFAVVDVSKVMTESNLGKKLKKEIEDKIQYYKSKIDELQKKYEEIDKQLQSPVLSEEGKKKKEEEKTKIEDKLRTIQMQAAEELNKMKINAEKKLTEKIKEIVKKYAEKHNIDIVLVKSPLSGVVYASEKIDITQNILKALNKATKEQK